MRARWFLSLALAGVGACAAVTGLDKYDVLGPDAPDAFAADGSPAADAALDVASNSDVDAGGDAAAGPCGDTTTSVANCGACGHSCGDGGCSDSVCTPTLLMSGLVSPVAVAVEGMAVYVADNSSGLISKQSPDPSVNLLVFNTAQAPRSMVVAMGRLYWTEQSKVRSVDVAGGTERDRGTNADSILVAGQDVYYSQEGPKRVSDLTLDLNNENLVTTATPVPGGLAADGMFVYWTDRSANGGIWRRRRDLTAVEELVVGGEVLPETIAVDPMRVYWTTPTEIRAASLTDRVPVTLVTGITAHPRSLLRDGENLYWLEGTTGLVRTISTRAGSVALTLARDELQLDRILTTAIAVDKQYVYWAASALGTVKRVPK